MEEAEIKAHMEEARRKALDRLSRYKFMQFGYWAAIWVHWKNCLGRRVPNPFRGIVRAAKDALDSDL